MILKILVEAKSRLFFKTHYDVRSLKQRKRRVSSEIFFLLRKKTEQEFKH